jgi:predicted RNase H-like HicB family nuclease
MASSLAHVLNQERLHLRIWPEDGVYVAQCLDIPGCVTQGGTHDEALANLHDAISLCLQVIMEDCSTEPGVASNIELFERPIEEFITKA